MMFDTTLAPPAQDFGVVDAMSAQGSALARKLDHHVRLTSAERTALDRVLRRDLRRLDARTPLVEQGAAPTEIHVVMDGWACRQTATQAGRRRIVAFYIPGDICDFDVFLMPAMDQEIAAIGAVRIAGISRSALNELSRSQPRVSQGLWWESLMSAAVQRAWTLNVGAKAAQQRIAHLLCELYQRLSLVGMANDGRCTLPLTQADLADACALTPVHTNRALQQMRASGLVDFADSLLEIHDWPALAVLGAFDGTYLQVAALRPRADPAPLTMAVSRST